MQTKIDFDIAILCGGLSSRFKDDKTLALIHEKSMIQYTIDSVRPLNKRIFLVCKPEHSKKYMDLNLDFSFDTEIQHASIYGLKAALLGSQKNQVLTLAADLPCFDLKIVEQLIQNFEGPSIIANNNGLQPLSSLYNKNIINELTHYLSQGKLAIQKFIKSINHTQCVFDNSHSLYFQNVNTKEDLLNLISSQATEGECFN